MLQFSSLSKSQGQKGPELQGAANGVMLLCSLLALVFLGIDIVTPAAIPSGVAYIVVVLVSLWSRRFLFTVFAASFSTAFIIFGYLMSPPVASGWEVLVERVVSIFAVWAVAFLSPAPRRIKEILRESENRFRQLAERTYGALILLSDDLERVAYVSPEQESITGRPTDEFYEDPARWFDIIHAEDKKRVAEGFYSQVLAGSFDEEYRILKADGSYRWVRSRGFPLKDHLGEAYRVGIVIEDIHQRKVQLDQLSEDEEHFRKLYEHGPVGLLLVDPETGKPVEWNDTTLEILGYPEDEFKLLRVSDFESSDNPLDAKLVFDLVKDGGIKNVEARYFTYKGEEIDVLVTARSIKLKSGTMLCMALRDVTQWQKGLHKDREQSRMLSQFTESIPAYVYRIDSKGVVTQCAGLGLKQIGMRETEPIGSALFSGNSELEGKVKECLSGKDVSLVADGTYRGEPWWFLHHLVFDKEQGKGAHGIAFNITEYRKKQEELTEFCGHLKDRTVKQSKDLEESHRQLLLSERHAALGALAANIFKEIGEPLSSIVNNAESAVRTNGHGDPQAAAEQYQKTLSYIAADAKRCGRVVERVSRFASRTGEKPAPRDLNEVIRDARGFTRKLAEDKGVVIELKLGRDLPPLEMDRAGMEQVLVGLMRYPMETAEGCSRVVVRSSKTSHSSRITIADDGPGVSVEERDKLFQPFFQPKNSKFQSGLGLSVIQAIVSQHGGKISVQSKEEGGTMFIIDFPLPRDTSEEEEIFSAF